MKKFYFLAAIAVAVLASCSNKEDATLDSPSAKDQAKVEPKAISFDAYTSRGVTRSGDAGDQTTAILKGAGKGFGVLAYYTNSSDYDGNSIPNFMYNDHVTHDGTKWNTETVKYWPNEYGSTAISEEIDKISFFAYAPWVEVSPTNGKVTGTGADDKNGITGLSRNSYSGDPYVKYIASFDAGSAVDLLWGHVDNAADATWKNSNNIANAYTLAKGLPWLNVERPHSTANGTDDKLKFIFDHALARMKWTVDTKVDGDALADADANTKVYIRSITFEGFAMKGALNLNNDKAGKPLWMSYDGTQDIETGNTLIVYDGRKDGKEGAQEANEKPVGFNADLVQSTLWDDASPKPGVTGTATSLFAATTGEYFYVIPTGDTPKVKIIYDIETKDDKLATYLSDGKTHGSSIENAIEQTFTTVTSFEAGKSYLMKLHIGLESVKLDAEVTDWPSDLTDEANLPKNN